jgi:effector-binding domain-containing protein
MGRVKVSLLFAPVVIIGAALIIRAAEVDPYKIDTVGGETVLYTIHRGGRETHREAVRKLYALAEEKEMVIEGNLTLVALNNPLRQDGDHMLTEIRLPVAQDALLEHAGTLGAMTDVKTLPPYKVVVFEKSPVDKIGIKDLLRLYKHLYNYALLRDEISMFGPEETFISRYGSGDYEDMRTDIKVPIWQDTLPGGE